MIKQKEILSRLRENYRPSCPLNHSSAWQLLLATILSAQCTDERVNFVTKELFEKYPAVKDIDRMQNDELIKFIRSTGFYNNKAKHIKGAARMILTRFNGKVPGNMDDLLKIPGVARKTANVVLNNWFKIADGIAVDTHVKRLSNRLGFSTSDNPEKIETDLMEIFSKKDWMDLSILLVYHGRKFCNARKPDCTNCFLNDICPKILKK